MKHALNLCQNGDLLVFGTQSSEDLPATPDEFPSPYPGGKVKLKSGVRMPSYAPQNQPEPTRQPHGYSPPPFPKKDLDAGLFDVDFDSRPARPARPERPLPPPPRQHRPPAHAMPAHPRADMPAPATNYVPPPLPPLPPWARSQPYQHPAAADHDFDFDYADPRFAFDDHELPAASARAAAGVQRSATRPRQPSPPQPAAPTVPVPAADDGESDEDIDVALDRLMAELQALKAKHKRNKQAKTT